MDNLKKYSESLQKLEEEFNLDFKDKELLFRCLIHDSFAFENEDILRSNERLEFLGDSVLGLVMSHMLFTMFPDKPEGDLALMKSALVSDESLAGKAREIDLGRFLFLGKGEDASGGRNRSSILSDSLEALIGAIFIDQGLEKAYAFVKNLFRENLESDDSYKDYKSKLQEYSQREFKMLPSYKVIGEEGPPHKKTFRVRVSLAGNIHGTGEGPTKKEAERRAARNLMENIKILPKVKDNSSGGMESGNSAPKLF